MSKKLFNESKKNYLFSIIEYGWYPFLLFLSTRYFVEYLGSYKYGVWIFVTTIVASTSILNVGLSGSVVKVVSTELGRGVRRELIENIANNASGIALASGVVTNLAIIIFAIIVWPDFAMDRVHLYATLATIMILVFLEYADIAFSSILKGGEYFRITTKIEVLFKTIQIVFALSVVVAWADLLSLYVVLVAVGIARVYTKLKQLKKVYGIRRIRPSFDNVSRLMIFAKWGWLLGLGGFMLGTIDRILVGSVIGPEALAYYSLLLMIPQQIHALTGAVLSVTFPRISHLHSSNRIGELKTLHYQISRVTIIGVGIPAALLVIFQDTIFSLWLGRDLPQDVMVAFTPLVLAYYLLSVVVPFHYMLLGLGQIRYVSIVNVIAGISSIIVLSTWLTESGLFIAAVAKIIYASILLIQLYEVNRIILRSRAA